MTDIIDRLRALPVRVIGSAAVVREAADEIERLRKRVTVLEEALALQVSTEFGKCPP